MEDSEQRKKRLKEMRSQADQAEVSGGAEGSGVPGILSNPLIEAPSTTPSWDKSYAAPRFDYYTDPMSAFSSNKRSYANIQAAQEYFPPPNFGGSPMAQFSSPHPGSTNPQMTPSPTQISPAAYRNPVWNGPRSPAQYNFPFRPSSGGIYSSPRFEPSGRPLYNSGQPRSPAQYNFPFRPSSGGIYSSPRFEPSGRPLYNSGQGIIHRPNQSLNPSPGYGNSPSPSQGRGRGFCHNTRSPVSGRGSSSRGHWSNEDRACGTYRFYKRSMVEDPWKLLKPLIWKATDAYSNTSHTPEISKPWTSRSINTKRGESSTASAKSNSEPSLAEYLAAAFNEAANDAENV